MIRQVFREASQPQPVEKADRNGWIKWGTDNLYAQYLVGLYYDNPIHGGIINQKVKFITAGGLECPNPELLENGSSPYNYQEIVELISKDFELFDGYPVHYKKSLVTGVWDAYPLDFELIRQTEDGIFFDVSDDWSKTRQNEKTGYRQIKSIYYVTDEDTECLFYNIQRPKQTKLQKSKDLTANYYPRPNYNGALVSIMAGIEMDYFTYSETVNSFKGGTVISLLNGVPETVEAENKILKKIKEEATDRDQQGGLTVLFADGKDRAPEISQMMGNDLDKRYIETGKEVLRKIMIAHGVISPALFGVLSESLFGSKEEMTVAYKLFQENYAKARQTAIEDGLNWAYLKLNKTALDISFKEYQLQLEQNVSEENAVSQSLNQMSPLVANKVLENLTINEIRSLARLTPLADGDVLNNPVPTAFSKDDTENIIELFSKCGVERKATRILHSQEYTSFEDNESDFKAQFIGDRFAMTISADDRNILQMIKNGESYDSISKAIGKGGVFLSKRLFLLQENGYIDGWEVTDKGVKESVVIAELDVLYSYELKPTAPDLVAGGKSRPFCERMMDMDRLYTREEINQISASIGRDVWTYRGGWYHNPTTDKNTPSCRHNWKQNIILKD